MTPATHNSMTFLKPVKWYYKIFRFMVQCQSLDILDQIKQGVKLFDLRIVFDENSQPHFAHGLVDFDEEHTSDIWTVEHTLETLNMFSLVDSKSGGSGFHVRILNERNTNYEKFKEFCQHIETTYTHLNFFGGINKKDWKCLYQFKTNPDKPVIDKYSSQNNDTPLGTGWHLDDLFPRIYALCFNKYWRKKYKDDDIYLLQDFVGKY